MADPLTRLGISRRPAYELFGTPDTSKFGWSDATRQAVVEDQAMADEAMAAEEERAALEDRRIAREREREAEGLADQITRMRNPSAREKFFDQNEAALTGSRRYNQLAEIRQRAPSYSDGVLANNLASKIDDPDERNVFLDAVSQGLGTLAAREEADRFRLRRGGMAALTKVGVPPKEALRIVDEEGYSPETINYHISQAEKSSTGGGDPVSALTKHVGILRDRLKYELDNTDAPNPETVEKLRLLESALEREYEKVYSPPTSPVLTQQPPPPADSVEAQQPVSGFKNVMAAGTPQAVTPSEKTPASDKPEPFPESAAPPHASLGNLGKKDLSDEDFTAAVGRFREYASAPTGMETYSQWMLRQKDVESKIRDAEEMRSEQKTVRQEVLPAWDAAKKDMESRVAAFSKKSNIPERVIYNTIAAGQSLTENADPRSQASDPSSVFTVILGTDTERRNPHLEKPVQKWDNQTFQAKPIQAFYRGLFGEFDVPTNSKVLQALAQEKAMGVPRTEVTTLDLPRVSTPEEASKLPPGTRFVTPDGKVRTVPTK